MSYLVTLLAHIKPPDNVMMIPLILLWVRTCSWLGACVHAMIVVVVVVVVVVVIGGVLKSPSVNKKVLKTPLSCR